jgi:ring-1,2-phenylacetyl-CoA epoxidase subunit PaaC
LPVETWPSVLERLSVAWASVSLTTSFQAARRLAVDAGVGIATASLQAAWNEVVNDTLAQATLKRSSTDGHVSTGKQCLHSEHLGFVLAEMQSLARAHPEAVW